MRRPLIPLVILMLLGLAVGWGSGSFLTRTRVLRVVENIPASPIVQHVDYDTSANALVFSVLNPGLMPLQMMTADFVFTPGRVTSEKGYVVRSLPIQTELPPQTVTAVIVPMREGAQLLMEGDVVMVTLMYTHPLADAVYTVAAVYTAGGSGEESAEAETASDTL